MSTDCSVDKGLVTHPTNILLMKLEKKQNNIKFMACVFGLKSRTTAKQNHVCGAGSAHIP